MPITKVDATQVPAVDKVTLRICAPRCFREFFLDGVEDNPQLVISALASNAQLQFAQLTGGPWEAQKLGQAHELVGHLKLRKETGDKLEAQTGHQGIFCTVLQRNEKRKPVYWVRRQEHETAENYARRCSQLAETRKQHLLFRRGGGNNLGFTKNEDDTIVESKESMTVWVFLLVGMNSLFSN